MNAVHPIPDNDNEYIHAHSYRPFVLASCCDATRATPFKPQLQPTHRI